MPRLPAFRWALLAALALGGRALALDPRVAIDQRVVDHWGREEGLPQGTVRAIAQDERGYLWLGTQEGIARFDGVRFRTYDRQTWPQLRGSYALAVLPLPGERLWAGYANGGLLAVAEGSARLYGVEEGLPDPTVLAILDRGAEGVWVGTRGGLAHFAGGRFRTYGTDDGLPANPAMALVDDGAGGFWIGTSGGLARFTGGRLLADPRLPEFVRSVLPGEGGALWVATDDGLVHLSASGLVRRRKAQGLPSDTVLRLVADRDGALWIGTEGGLARLPPGADDDTPAEPWPADHVLGRSPIRGLFEDREGSLWVGTDGYGLYRLVDGSFHLYGAAQGLGDAVPTSLHEAADGARWVATDKGLFALAGGRLARVGPPDLQQAALWTLVDEPGVLWVGGTGGLWSRGGDRWTRWRDFDEEEVKALLVDRRGTMWVGTDYGGLRSRAPGGGFVDALPGQSGLGVWALAEAPDGSLWAGTTDRGLLHLRDGRVVEQLRRDQLGSDKVLAVHVDPDGTVWAGTDVAGLVRLRPGAGSKGWQVVRLERRSGLASDTIQAVVDDGRGALWLPSNQGIARLARADVDAFAAGRLQRLPNQLFARADGLLDPECNGGNHPNALRLRDGRLWFSTMGGVAVVDPAHLVHNPVIPAVAIEELVADDRAVSSERALDLPALTRRIDLHFTGLTLRAPERARFRYRLVGSDERWSETTARSVTYTNLPARRLRFEVMASNDDGVWNPVPAALELRRRPRVHETWWFVPSLAVLLLTLAVAVHGLRLRQLRARFAAVLDERTRLARELHDTLAQGMAAIGMQIEAASGSLDRDPSAVARHLHRAGELARNGHDEVRRSIADLRPARLDGQGLQEALAREAAEAARDRGVEVSFRSFGRPRPLAPAAERELLRIAQEALGNALRHASPRRVDIELHWSSSGLAPGRLGLAALLGGRLRLLVRDDGRGFDPRSPAPARPGGGMGLRGLHERAAGLGGVLRIDSTPGRGTCVEIQLPWRAGRRA